MHHAQLENFRSGHKRITSWPLVMAATTVACGLLVLSALPQTWLHVLQEPSLYRNDAVNAVAFLALGHLVNVCPGPVRTACLDDLTTSAHLRYQLIPFLATNRSCLNALAVLTTRQTEDPSIRQRAFEVMFRVPEQDWTPQMRLAVSDALARRKRHPNDVARQVSWERLKP